MDFAEYTEVLSTKYSVLRTLFSGVVIPTQFTASHHSHFSDKHSWIGVEIALTVWED